MTRSQFIDLLRSGFTQEELAAVREMFQNSMREEQEKKLRFCCQLNQTAKTGQTLFTGSSLMEQFPVGELIQGKAEGYFYNRGIGGFTTDDFLRNIDTVLLDLAPKKVFINIGTNDLSMSDYSPERLIENYRAILRKAGERLGGVVVYVMAYYPMNEKAAKNFGAGARTNLRIHEANNQLRLLASEFTFCHYINVNDGLTDKDGELRSEWTVDGIHMYPEAYEVVLRNLMPYIKGEADGKTPGP